MNFRDAHGSEALGYPKINMDLVAVLRPVRSGGKYSEVEFDCYDINDEKLGRISAANIDDDQGVVVPDHTGTFVLSFYEDTDDIGFIKHPVIAWRIVGKSAEPIICESMPSYGHWCLWNEGSGEYVFPEDSSYKELDGVKALIRENFAKDIQEREERRQRIRASLAVEGQSA